MKNAVLADIFIGLGQEKKSIKHANERADGIIHSTKHCVKSKNRTIPVNLLQRPLKLVRLIALHATHLWL